MAQTNEQKYRKLQCLLMPGESLLWHGGPQNLKYQPNWFKTLFGLVWTAFSGYAWLSMLKSEQWMGVVFLSLFVVVGISMLVDALYKEPVGNLRAYYGITRDRVIVMSPHKVKVFLFAQNPAMELEMHPDGTGTIVFPDSKIVQGSKGRTRVEQDNTYMHHIPNATTVFNLIQSQILAAGQESSQ